MNYYLNAFKNYATFSGRARRSEYWFFFLFTIILSTLIGMLGTALSLGFLGIIFFFASIIPGIAVTVRRMHDVGKSGWYSLIPFYNLILTLTEGTKGDNEYGSDPKATNAA